METQKNDAQNIFSARGREMPPAVRPVVYSGVRIERYQTIYASRRALGAADYREAILELNRQQRRADTQAARRERQREIREAARRAEEARAEREREAQRAARREAVRTARNARRREARAVAAEARHNVRRGVDIQRMGGWRDKATFEAEGYPELINQLRRVVGERRAYMQLSRGRTVIRSQLFEVEGNDAPGIYYNNIRPFLHPDTMYDGDTNLLISEFVTEPNGDIIIRRYPENVDVRFVVLIADVIPPGSIRQRYRDGIKHCVLEPLSGLWKSMGDNSESPASAKRCHQIARRLAGLKNTYPDGVPDGIDMEAVARVAHRCIVLHDILGNEIKRYNDKSPKYFYFTNTRINHLDEGRLTMDKTYEKVTDAQMMNILREHDNDGVFYLFSGNPRTNKCQSLRSIRGCWAVFNEDYELFQEFNEKTGVNKYGIDAVKHASLNDFLLESRIINSQPTPLCDEPNNIDDTIHVDVEKAYTQHKFAPIYRGFLGHITDFVKLPAVDATKFLAEHVGIFKFAVTNDAPELLQKLGIFKGKSYTLPSPEIEYMISLGVNVVLQAGAWGSTFDIEYTDEMLKNRRYCIWAGKLGMDSCDNTYTFKGDLEWARCLRDILGDGNVYYFQETDMIAVRVPKKGYKTRHHILAFITSYTRMNLLNMMSKVEGSLVKVVLDGLYYRGEMPDIELPIHKNKKGIKHEEGCFKQHWYYPSKIDTFEWEAYEPRLDVPADCVKNVCVLTGAGGNGKSHTVLTRKSIPRILYVTPTNALGRKKRAEFGIDYTSIHKLIGMECRPFIEDHYEPAAILLDELTMIEKSWVDKALEMYPNTKFYIAGDVDEKQWYQCRNGHPGKFSEVWMPRGKDHAELTTVQWNIFTEESRFKGTECHGCKNLICFGDKVWEGDDIDWCLDCYKPVPYHCFHHSTDYRSKDEELKKMKEDIRAEMRRVFTDGGQNDASRMSTFARKNYKTTPFAEAVKMFVPGDIWIAGTHKTNEKLLKEGIVSGFKNAKNEIVTDDDPKGEKRGSFTTHSFQGLTLETERLFISLDFFEYAMLYTSVSRIRNMSQLIIVV